MFGVEGWTNTPIRAAVGTASRKISRRLMSSSGPRIAKPVALPRDRDSGRLGSRSSASAPYMTTGMVSDAAMLAAIASPPTARIASGVRAHELGGDRRHLIGWTRGRASITRLRPSTKPSFASSGTVASRRSAATRAARQERAETMTLFRPAGPHASWPARLRDSPARTSRRLIRSPRRRGRGASGGW